MANRHETNSHEGDAPILILWGARQNSLWTDSGYPCRVNMCTIQEETSFHPVFRLRSRL